VKKAPKIEKNGKKIAFFKKITLREVLLVTQGNDI